MDESTQREQYLDERLFKRTGFQFFWLLFLGVVLVFVSWPIRNIALVCWVYGVHGYFDEGIRVLPGKATRFSNGVEAASFPDFVTGLGAFLITVVGLSMLLVFALRLYERRFGQQPRP